MWRQHMRRGDFESAWRVSDCILRNRNRYTPDYSEGSTWGGESLDRKRVLVRCCYGLGDTLQFIRYAARLRRIASRVIVHTQPTITRVLEHVNGIDAIATHYDTVAADDYDVAVGITELPHVFRTNLQTIPIGIPYIELARRSFPAATGLRVGLVWEGSDWDRRRAVPLQLFAAFEHIEGIGLHILQRGSALLQRPADFGTDSGSDDVYEAARTICGLDLLITIDSMPAHLAGAIGVPTWVLLHSDCDWRWMENRTDSPWYPTMRLFRQKTAGDWEPVIACVKQELEQLANARAQALSKAA